MQELIPSCLHLSAMCNPHRMTASHLPRAKFPPWAPIYQVPAANMMHTQSGSHTARCSLETLTLFPPAVYGPKPKPTQAHSNPDPGTRTPALRSPLAASPDQRGTCDCSGVRQACGTCAIGGRMESSLPKLVWPACVSAPSQQYLPQTPSLTHTYRHNSHTRIQQQWHPPAAS